MKRWGLLGVVLVLLGQASSQAVGTVTVTTTNLSDLRAVKYSLAWVSDGSGDVSANAQTFRPGSLIQIRFIPDGGGTAPSAAYDVTLVDASGFDYLGGTGADLSATVTTTTRVAAPVIYDATGTLDLVVANAGSAKGGTVQLWIQVQQ